jgi:translation initiation factor 1
VSGPRVSNSRLVYSTDGGRVKIVDERPRSSRKSELRVPDDGVVRVFRERAGRSGKVVTVLRGLPERGPALTTLAADLKRLCGAGGTVKDRVVEIQGDHWEKVTESLRERGYLVKLAGG